MNRLQQVAAIYWQEPAAERCFLLARASTTYSIRGQQKAPFHRMNLQHLSTRITVKDFGKNLTVKEPRDLRLKTEVISQKIALRSDFIKKR
jgi:hypothetical protein